MGARYDLTTEDCVNVNECDLGICLNGATCTDVDPLTNDGKMYQCSCVDGYRGVTCAATAAALSQSSLSITAAIIILMAILIFLREYDKDSRKFQIGKNKRKNQILLKSGGNMQKRTTQILMNKIRNP